MSTRTKVFTKANTGDDLGGFRQADSKHAGASKIHCRRGGLNECRLHVTYRGVRWYVALASHPTKPGLDVREGYSTLAAFSGPSSPSWDSAKHRRCCI